VGIYEVTNVSLVDLPGELSGFNIELPEMGGKGNLYALHITGWIVGKTSPAVAIEVLYHNRLLRTVEVRGPRPDIAAAFDGVSEDTPCAFHALVGLLGLKLECDLRLRAIFADGTRVPLAEITLRREALRTEYEPVLAPLMLTCLGRTGTTWLMKMFTSHPQILVFRRFPYESATAKYWLHMLRVLSEPADLAQSAEPDGFHNVLHWVGQNPFHDDTLYEQPALANWFARNYVESLATFCQRTIDDWYITLARNQNQHAPVYFAEKHMWPNFLPVLAWELYPKAKEVFLVRDFRDMAVSILDFDRKRGYPGFGRPDGKSDEDYIKDEMRAMTGDLKRSWETRGERAHLVRYEDMVFRPVETLTSLLEYLEIDASQPTVDMLLERSAEEVPELPGTSKDPFLVRVHRTSPDPKASIGRWQRESDEPLQELYWEVFGDALEGFGYSRSGYSP
jgi:hypothetical protein